MARLIRKTAILAKLEATYGQAAVPNGATDAMLISDATIDYQYKNVSRALLRPLPRKRPGCARSSAARPPTCWCSDR